MVTPPPDSPMTHTRRVWHAVQFDNGRGRTLSQALGPNKLAILLAVAYAQDCGQPEVSSATVSELTGVSNDTARHYLNRLMGSAWVYGRPTGVRNQLGWRLL